jgi:hypothetical protein
VLGQRRVDVGVLVGDVRVQKGLDQETLETSRSAQELQELFMVVAGAGTRLSRLR